MRFILLACTPVCYTITWSNNVAAPMLSSSWNVTLQNYNPFSNPTEHLVKNLYKLHSSIRFRLSLPHNFPKTKTMVSESLSCSFNWKRPHFIQTGLFRRSFGITLCKTLKCVMQETWDVIQDSLVLASKTLWGVMKLPRHHTFWSTSAATVCQEQNKAPLRRRTQVQ